MCVNTISYNLFKAIQQFFFTSGDLRSTTESFTTLLTAVPTISKHLLRSSKLLEPFKFSFADFVSSIPLRLNPTANYRVNAHTHQAYNIFQHTVILNSDIRNILCINQLSSETYLELHSSKKYNIFQHIVIFNSDSRNIIMYKSIII
jgi:hypothetical protein